MAFLWSQKLWWMIPLVTMLGTVFALYLVFGGTPLLDPKNTTLVSRGVGCIFAQGLACWLTKETPVDAIAQDLRACEETEEEEKAT